MAAGAPAWRLPLWAAVCAAVVAGLAMDGAFPSLGWWPLAFVAIPLALLSLVGRSVGGAVLVGGAYGLAFYLPHVSWAGEFLGDHPQAWVPWVALATAESLLVAVLSPLITLAYRWWPQRRDTWSRPVALPLLVAGAWLVRELVIGSWPYGGLPWGRAGMSQSDGPLAEVASWVGVSGLGLLMVALCAGAVEAVLLVRHRRSDAERPHGGAPSAARWTAALPTAALAVALLLVPQYPTTAAGTLRVGAVQGDGPAAYVDDREAGDLLDSQLEASAPLEDESVDVVLWPEGGVGSDPLAHDGTARALDSAVERYEAPILLNAASARGDAVYNTSMLWTEDGAAASHAKRHPVPFGEYVPHRELYGTIAPDLIGLLEREYAHGSDTPAVDVDDVRAGLAICFDVVFDDVVREGAHDGAQVYLFQTNNADFRGTDENLQQLEVARMRAVETGRSVVNLSTTGTSQIFAPDGSTVAALPVGEPGVMLADVELRDGLTAGIVLGPWVERAVVVGTLLTLAGLAIVTARRRGPTPPPSRRPGRRPR